MRLRDKGGLHNIYVVMEEVNSVVHEVRREWRKENPGSMYLYDEIHAEVKLRICKKLLELDYADSYNTRYYEMMREFIVTRQKWKPTGIYYVGTTGRYHSTYGEELRGYRQGESIPDSIQVLNQCVWMDECVSLENAIEIRRADYEKGIAALKTQELKNNIEWQYQRIKAAEKEYSKITAKLLEKEPIYSQYSAEVVQLEEWLKTCPVDTEIPNVTAWRKKFMNDYTTAVKDKVRQGEEIHRMKKKVTEWENKLNWGEEE